MYDTVRYIGLKTTVCSLVSIQSRMYPNQNVNLTFLTDLVFSTLFT